MGGFVDRAAKQVPVQPPSCSSPGEIQTHVRMKKWLNMGLSDQIFHQSSTLRDSFSHQFIHFWILITYISAVLNILVNIGTVCLGVTVGVLVCVLLFLGGFCLFMFFFAWFLFCFGWLLFWWGVILVGFCCFFELQLANLRTLLTCGGNKISKNCPLFKESFSPHAQQSTL